MVIHSDSLRTILGFTQPSLALSAASPWIRLCVEHSSGGFRCHACEIITRPCDDMEELNGTTSRQTRVTVRDTSDLSVLTACVGWWLSRQRQDGAGHSPPLLLKLDGHGVSCSNVTEDALSLIPLFDKISIRSCSVVPPFSYLGKMGMLSNLTYIDMSYTDLGDIDWIRTCVSLHTLRAGGCERLKDISIVSKLEYVRYIDIQYTMLENIDWVSDCRSLRRLNVSGCKRISSFSAIGTLGDLQELNMANTHVKHIGWIETCSSLEILNIDNCEDLQDTHSLSKLQNTLKELHMNFVCHSSMERMDWISSCSALEILTVSGCEGIVDFSGIGSLQKLKRLVFNNGNARNVAWIANCVALDTLDIRTNGQGMDYSSISQLPSLRDLCVMDPKMGNVDWIGGCTFLERLCLSGGGPSALDCSAIGKLQYLKYLDVSTARIEEVDWVEGCASLEELHVGRRCSDSDVLNRLNGVTVHKQKPGFF